MKTIKQLQIERMNVIKTQIIFNDKNGQTISIPIESLKDWCETYYPQESITCKTEEEYLFILHRHYSPIFQCEFVQPDEENME